MGSTNSNGQSGAEKAQLIAAWEATPEVQQMNRDCLAQILTEQLEWNEVGLTRVFAIVREWEQDNGPLPDSGVRATG